MKHKVFFSIAIRIIILCFLGMMHTYLPEHLRGFFGDTICPDGKCGGIDEAWEWGVRHYWYYTMMISLLLLSLANLIISTVNIVRKNYTIENW